MKKILIILGSLLVLFLIYGKHAPMKLVNVKTGSVVVEFQGRDVKFHDRILEQQMKKEGILVPPFRQKDFGDKKRIYFDDPLFQKAFKEIYYPQSCDPTLYRWDG